MSNLEYDLESERAPTGGFSVLDALHIVRARAFLIMGCAIVMGALAAAYALMLPRAYDATATILIEPRQQKLLNMDQVLSGLKVNTPTIESEVEIIASRQIAGRVINALRLDEDPEFNGGASPLDPLRRWLWGEPARQDVTLDRLVQESASTKPIGSGVFWAFASRLSVQRRRNTYLISITFRSRDKHKAARIANAIAEAYLEAQVEAKSGAAEKAAVWLEDRVSELRTSVHEAEQAVERFKRENNLVDVEGQSLDEKQITRLMEQLILARANTASSRAKFEQLKKLLSKKSNGSSMADVLQNHTVTSLKTQLAQARRQAAELRTKYGRKHPALKKARADVADIRAQLEAEIKRVVANFRNEYEVARSREVALASSLERMKSRDNDSNEAEIKLRELSREAEANRYIYEAFMRRYRETIEQRGFQLPDARIVEEATAPFSPNAPKRTRIAVIGLVLGIGLGLGVALGLHLVFPTLLRREQIENRYGLDALVTLPGFAARENANSSLLKATRYLMAEPDAPFSDALRALRLAVDRHSSRTGPRVVLIASAHAGDGRTVIASNLAHQYAMIGARTLLVDADLRSPDLSNVLAPEREAGLADALTGRVALGDAIISDSTSGLNFLPAVSRREGALHQPSELLSAPQMADAVESLRSHFDLVVIDAPAALAAVDARIVADHCDEIIFVANWRTTSCRVAAEAIRRLAMRPGDVAGVVLNKVRPAEHARLQGTALARPGVGGFAAQLGGG